MKLNKVVLPARLHHQVNNVIGEVDSEKKGMDAKTKGLRRVWTINEEETLLRVLEKVVAEGARCENGTFKAGTMMQIEKELNLILPNCGLKANPHIDSKQRKWKKLHRMVFDMLKTNGFAWNDKKKCVEVDSDEVWMSYVQAHREARGWRGKPLPIYERLVNIYGKECATTQGAETPVDMVEEINRVETQEENRVDNIEFLQVEEPSSSPVSVQQPSSSHQIDRTSSETSNRKRTRTQRILTAGFKEISSTIQHVLNLSFKNMEMLFEHILNDREDRSDIANELGTMGLDEDDELEALCLILEKPSNISAFKSLRDARRLAFVKKLLRDRPRG